MRADLRSRVREVATRCVFVFEVSGGVRSAPATVVGRDTVFSYTNFGFSTL
jgi:hypothetical protein